MVLERTEMHTNLATVGTRAVLESAALGQILAALQERGYTVLGPSVRDGAIVIDAVEKIEDLPAGWTDEQEASRYRLKKSRNGAFFGYGLGPQAWKRYLHPPELLMFDGRRDGGSFRMVRNGAPPPKYAFFGVRPCELAAIRMQDRIFLEDRYADPGYRARRGEVFIIAVNCTRAGGTCFCASMGTGPRAGAGFDLALTEIDGRFVVEAGTEAGSALLADIDQDPAGDADIAAADAAIERAKQQKRSIDVAGVREVLFDSFDHPRWEKTAARCLSCANCTLVCPTCFCTTVEDVTDLSGENAQRWRKWDSCFTDSFSYIHGGSVRQSVKSRYRQWLTHKLAAWVDQFGTFGCVGCGRCITWCPGGIDITEEVRVIRGAET